MWYNKKDVVRTLEALQKMANFYHQKEIDMLKLGCTSHNLANICLHKSADSKFYPFTESDKDLLEKIHEDLVGGPSIAITRKAVADETFIRKSMNLCESIVGIDANQLYPYSMCQPMPTGMYTIWNFDPESQKTLLRKNGPLFFFNRPVRIAGLKTMLQLVDRRRLIALMLMEFVTIVTLFLKQWVVISSTVQVKKLAHP